MGIKAKQTSVVTASGSASHSAAGNWVILNPIPTPFNVGFGVHFSAANTTGAGPSFNIGIQHTFDDLASLSPQEASAARAYREGAGTVGSGRPIVVYDHSEVSGVSANLTLDVDGNYAFPCAAARLVINSVVSATAASVVSGFARFVQSGV